jgi:phosphopantothenoylcysteine synthetase/decarboxylase
MTPNGIYYENPKSFDIIILAAAVSDYGTVPVDGKIRTKDNLNIELQPLPKVISKIRGIVGEKTKIVGFKLLVNSTKEELEASARDSLIKNNLDMVIANDLRDIKSNNHKLLIVEKDKPTDDTDLITKFRFKDPNLLARIVVQRSVLL